MLPSASSLADQIKAIVPENDAETAATNFISVIAAFANQVQAGEMGTPGILTYNNSAAISGMLALTPTGTQSWVPGFANAIHSGVSSGTLTPGTVTDPEWTDSDKDTEPPMITNLSAALSLLESELDGVTYANNAPEPLAQAIHDYMSSIMFQCTGLATTDGPPEQIPITFQAQ